MLGLKTSTLPFKSNMEAALFQNQQKEEKRRSDLTPNQLRIEDDTIAKLKELKQNNKISDEYEYKSPISDEDFFSQKSNLKTLDGTFLRGGQTFFGGNPNPVSSVMLTKPTTPTTPPSPISTANETNTVYAKDINKFDVLESIPNRKSLLGVSHEEILNKKKNEINNNKQELSKKKEDNAVELASNKNTASKSRTRMGLFGNYGKDVEIRKTSDETTGKVNREKLVDGKVVKSRFETKEFKDSRKRGNENKKYAKSVNKYDAKYDKKANKK
jgi:hypothetical protein